MDYGRSPGLSFVAQGHPISTVDGVKIEFPENGKEELIEWVHLRKSNTEPIIRIYAESDSQATADHLAQKIMMDIREIISPNRL